MAGTSWDVSEGIFALCPAKLWETSCIKQTRGTLRWLMNSVLLSAHGDEQQGDTTAVDEQAWLNVAHRAGGVWCWQYWQPALGTGVGGNESHPAVSHRGWLSRPACGLYLIRLLGSFSVHLLLLEELAETVNCLSVLCVLTTRWHHTHSVFYERFQWDCFTPDLQTWFCLCDALSLFFNHVCAWTPRDNKRTKERRF